ncbi:Phospholipase D1 [Xylographa parallela]|nr:Phospholipase D1 [Xylographa parallela]
METPNKKKPDSSPPPMTLPASTPWPETGLKFRKDFLQPAHATTYSPLRSARNVDESPDSVIDTAGGEKGENTSGVTFASITEGFPFHGGSGSERPATSEADNNGIGKQAAINGTATTDITRGLTARRTSDTANLPSESTSRKRSNIGGSTTPPGRRSVQFVRPAGESSQSENTGPLDVDPSLRDRRGGSLLTKIRALAGSSSRQIHTRSPSAFTIGGDSIDERLPTGGLFTADVDREHPYFAESPDEDEDEADADGEQSTAEDTGPDHAGKSRRRKSRRPQDGGAQTAPTTPKTPFMQGRRPNMLSSNSATSNDGKIRPLFPPRRATMTDLPMDEHQGVSEDEGRERLARGSPWKRGSAWVHSPRGMSYGGTRSKPTQQLNHNTPRPSNFRRAITGFGGSGDGVEGTPFSPWKLRGERTSSLSAAKWRQIKAGLKMIGQRRKAEITIDHAKSAELLAELTAGVPAVLILASMFQRDEHGNRKIPVLLEQLKVKLTDSKQVDSKSGDRHMIFRIELEYGNGLTRMKWVIHRALRDFANLHARYKLQISAQKYIQRKDSDARTKMPHFPRSAFPYLRGIRGLDSESEAEEDLEGDGTGASGGDGSATERPGRRKRSRPSMSIMRRKSSAATDPALGTSIGGVLAAAGGTVGAAAGASSRKDPFAERQRRKLELYLQQMIRYLIFRPESNRLCKFLELSALGVRLAAEGSYHGKEGLLILQSGKGVDFRKKWTPTLLKARHGPKWFLVRHSYVVCVDSPEEMNIYDVFLVDSDFKIQTKKKRPPIRDQNPKELAKSAKESAAHPQNHTLKLYNSERKLRLLAKNERQLHQFEDSIRFMSTNTPWAKVNRFDSFAPVRPKVFAQWLVDGRDYMWNVSRAISMAKDVIYIHDWWLSPELYMRRPAAISQKWRLDRLLQRKAQEGVKVFVIMYRNINSAIPIDSEYSKFSLLDLHPNVFVQRSPNQIRQGTFFWAHHEKICIVDHMVAFVGGIDLCFGRWDTPQHTVVDDKLTGFEQSDMPKDADHCQLWPGKDYSNPRVQDFYALDKPYEEMYDRTKVPRMPWHDISMQVVGQPARDLTRHFVQRWNYILRQRRPTRPTPFLLPPPDFNPADLEALGLDGTCEVQILRSCCMWSLGTPDRVEHSIMDAYIKMIQQSDHFVYVENQFFVTSTEVEGTRIENSIGDALVERIIRAYQNNEDWRAIIVIPLLPGFQNTVDSQDGTSVRLIMQCQFRSINRGDSSIFGRLRAEGIEPEDYIHFFSLRSWGKIGPNKSLVTEQLYIHAKCMVVDDRIAIIGSANINERSMLGSRDSECAAVVRDTDMLWSTMAGEPYLVGRFPHTLRMRLMREHLGIDVDAVMEDEKGEQVNGKWEKEMDQFHGESEKSPDLQDDRETDSSLIEAKHKIQDDLIAKSDDMYSFNHDIDWEQAENPNLVANKRVTTDSRVTGNAKHRKDVAGEGADHMKDNENTKAHPGRQSSLQDEAGRSSTTVASGSLTGSPVPRPVSVDALPLPPQLPRMSTFQLGLPMLSQLPALPKSDDTDIGGPSIQRMFSKKASAIITPVIADMKRPMVDQDCMKDPLNDSFYLDTWLAVAENNTKLFRAVFRCMPDNEVKNWKEYKEYAAYGERFAQAQGGGKPKERVTQEVQSSSGPPGQANLADRLRLIGPIGEKAGNALQATGLEVHNINSIKGNKSDEKNKPMGEVEDWAADANREQREREAKERRAAGRGAEVDEKLAVTSNNDGPLSDVTNSTPDAEKPGKTEMPRPVGYSDALNATSQKRRRRAATRGSKKEFHASDDMIGSADAEELLKMVQGSLVVWPYEWLAKEEQGGNWLYSIDQLAPLEI